MNGESLIDALDLLGELVEARGEHHELALIGGGALLLIGAIVRPTKDIDVVALRKDMEWKTAEPLPAGLVQAVRDVATAMDLAHDWLNAGPTSLLDYGLPAGFFDRAIRREHGGLTLHVAARRDQIAFNLFAAADHWPDRSRHVMDLERLSPTPDELAEAADWCQTHDPSEGFAGLLAAAVAGLGADVD